MPRHYYMYTSPKLNIYYFTTYNKYLLTTDIINNNMSTLCFNVTTNDLSFTAIL